jgi:tetratricopeptide (TPR) repeat protein
MFRRILLLSCAAFLVALVGVNDVFAQGAPVRGTVKLVKADGTSVPVADALVEVFKTDGRGTLPSSKTNKRGEFSFVQFPYGSTYSLSISGAGIAPEVIPGVRAGLENINVTVKEGDGRKYTEDEVRQSLAGASAPVGEASGELTEEQKKAKAEYDAKVAAVEAGNKKVEEANATIARTLQEGNAAFNAKNWDVAIAKYTEGVNASPDFAGSAPVLLNNKGAALRERAVSRYNQSVKLTDPSAKVAGLQGVRSDLVEAVEGYHRSWTLLKNASATDISDPKLKETQTNAALTGAKDALRLMAATEQVDETKLNIAKELIPAYIAIEPDAVKKESAMLILADMYRVAGDADNSIAEYRKILTTSPDSLDAMAGLGLSLVNAGYINNNKEQLQEGSNVLQKFASAAPDSHKYKNDAVALIEDLKGSQKITPQKTTTRRKN